MKFNTRIPISLHAFFADELAQYATASKEGNLKKAWTHLEQAHIIGQSYPWPHTLVHWKMLFFGIKIKSRKEILGQLPRLLFGGVKSFVGTVPLGNPGGANVPPLRPYAIHQNIREIFEQAGIPFQDKNPI